MQLSSANIPLNVTALNRGWLKVRANHGAAGADHISITTFGQSLDNQLTRLADELANQTYVPSPLRRCEIRPAGKKARVLGIPTVRDRVVQATVTQALTPLAEQRFIDASHGYRPRRSVATALTQVDHALRNGNHWVLDADIRTCFTVKNCTSAAVAL